MKSYISLLLFSAIVFVGCNKADTGSTENGNNVSSFKFTVNGEVYETSGTLVDTDNTSTGNGVLVDKSYRQTYTIWAKNTNSKKFYAMIPLSSSIAVGTYNFFASPSSRNGEIILSGITSNWYGPLYDGDNYSVTITRNDNGYLSGTITAAQLTGTSSLEPKKIQITNGEFKNVKVVE